MVVMRINGGVTRAHEGVLRGAAVAQLVERVLGKDEVTGSSPVSSYRAALCFSWRFGGCRLGAAPAVRGGLSPVQVACVEVDNRVESPTSINS